ncbi:glycosyltransferase family 2 protein [Candidatus Saccharibacteria bacterium]|nr:glycosyltransferase family 2 protein [Candidatus Saccharibacteria bacterium]
MKKISFVIPCYKSSKTIGPVTEEIVKTVKERAKEFDYEILAVNDHSPDDTWKVLVELAEKDPKFKAINLAKNMNRPGAVMAGLGQATGDYVIMMDDDGQCPMDELWKLIAPLEEGHDVAMAKYTEYKQSAFKSFGTIFNRKMTEIIMDKPKDLDFTNFIAMKKYICDEIIKYKNPYPYFTGLLLRTTSDLVNVKMEERSRLAGSTNFTFGKMVSLWMNGFTAFSVKPLRIATILGFISAAIGFIYGLVIIIMKIANPDSISDGYSSIMAIILLIGGIIMLMLGLIGEYIGRIYISINNSPQYVIKEAKNLGKKN